MKKFFTKHSRKFLYPFIFLALISLHVTYLPNGFTWLDHGDIEEGRALLPLEHLSDAFFMRFGETGFYRPLVTISHSLDYAVYNLFAPGYHLTNVFLHVLVAMAAPLLLSCFLVLTLPETLFVILLVGIHPLSSLPVGSISYRPELLLTLFTMLTLYLHVQSRRKNKQSIGFLSLITFYLALLAKETAIILIPVMIIVWEFWNRHKLKSPPWPLILSESFIVAIYLLFRFRAVPEYWRVEQTPLSFFDAVGTRVHVYSDLLLTFFQPVHRAISDSVQVTSLTSWSVWGSLILFGLLGYLLWKNRLKSEWSRLLILWLIVCLPALTIVPVPRIGSPHYGYVAVAFFAGMLVLFFRFSLTLSTFAKKLFTILFCVWLGVMLVTAVTDGLRFKNDKTLFLPEVQADNHFLEGYFYLGNWYLAQGDFGPAESYYKKAMQSQKSHLAYAQKRAILVNLASVYLAQDNLSKADQTLTQAEFITDNQNVTGLVHNRMLYLYKKHDYKGVFELSQDGRAFPYAKNTYIILADSLHHLNRDKEARQLLQSLLPYVSGSFKKQIEVQLKTLQE